jgi:alkylhydroperoxidase family enzyme
MARIPYPEIDKLPAELRELLKQTNLHIFNMWAHSVNTVEFAIRLGAAQFAKLELPRSIRELATLFVGRANSADYEWVQHVALAKAAGVTDAQIAALQQSNLDPAVFSAEELAALRLVAAVVAGPKVSDDVFNSAQKYFNNRQLVELIGVVGYYWMVGRMATVFQVDLDVAQGTAVFDTGVRLADDTNR